MRVRSRNGEARQEGGPSNSDDIDSNKYGSGSHASTDSVLQQGEALAAAAQARAKLESVFSALYPRELPEENGMKASRNERLSKGYESVTLTYGEVSATGVSFLRERTVKTSG